MYLKFSTAFKSLSAIALATILFVATPLQAETKESILSDEWQFDAQLYIWAADFAGELNNAATFDVPFDTLEIISRWDFMDHLKLVSRNG